MLSLYLGIGFAIAISILAVSGAMWVRKEISGDVFLVNFAVVVATVLVWPLLIPLGVWLIRKDDRQ